MRLQILHKVAGSTDPQPRGASLSVASKVSALVCALHMWVYLQRNVSVEAGFGRFVSVDSWDLLCGVKDGRWPVCPESVGFAAAVMRLLSQSL